MKKNIVLLVIGLLVGMVCSTSPASMKGVPFLEEQNTQTTHTFNGRNAEVITKYYDNQNGYCVYTITAYDVVGIAVIKP